MITNDKKPDWVYTPRMILDKSGDIKPNNGSSSIKIDLPLPFLQSEFKFEVGEDLDFMLCNIELISHLCSSASFNPKEYNKYEQLAEAVSVESQKDDTYLVISWFLNNQKEYHYCIKTVAYWERSPQEIDDEALRNYIGIHMPNIDMNQVDMTEIICELFI